jgi:hypothetical protein
MNTGALTRETIGVINRDGEVLDVGGKAEVDVD